MPVETEPWCPLYLELSELVVEPVAPCHVTLAVTLLVAELAVVAEHEIVGLTLSKQDEDSPPSPPPNVTFIFLFIIAVNFYCSIREKILHMARYFFMKK
jgi:hypothetical protein